MVGNQGQRFAQHLSEENIGIYGNQRHGIFPCQLCGGAGNGINKPSDFNTDGRHICLAQAFDHAVDFLNAPVVGGQGSQDKHMVVQTVKVEVRGLHDRDIFHLVGKSLWYDQCAARFEGWDF